MTEHVAASPAITQPPPPTGGPARLNVRAASLAIDCGLLSAALLWVMLMNITIGSLDELGWLTLVWAVVVAPLYFGLYHAYGTGATPGQRELGVAVRGVAGNTRISLGLALFRAYVAPILFVPRLRDHVTRSRVLSLETPAEAQPTWPSTAPELTEIFEPPSPGRALRRSLRLVRGHRRELVRPVFAVYLSLVVVAAVVAPLFIEDFGGASDTGALEAGFWTVIASLLFASGVYWKQAAVSIAVEAIRTGERIGTGEVVRRTFRRANALSAGLLLLMAGAFISLAFIVGWVLLPLAFARLMFFVSAIAIEDRHVLASFRRSAKLTQGKTWRILGKLIVSTLATILALTVAANVGVGITLGFLEGVGADLSTIGYAYAIAFGLVLASIPMSLIMAVIGTTWALLFHDLREIEAAKR